jgi:hypothetical protein
MTRSAMLAYRQFRPPHLLSQALDEFLGTQSGRDFISLLSLFPVGWKGLVMGGLLRDLLMQQILKIDRTPADVDMIISGADSIEEIKDKLGTVIRSTNAFGGVKCQLRPNGMVFDLWRVEDHTNMALAPKPHTIEQILRHNLLDVDAVLWDSADDSLHDCGCVNAIKAQRIEMMGSDGISREFLATQVAHVLVVAFKTNFTLSDGLRSFVADASARCRSSDIENAVKRKLPQAVAQIELFWNDLLSGGSQRCPGPTRAVSL